ncbi:helix-turn-helix domain-containing protein [Neolewinella agarilytica]|uniref:Helix-turn-helix n=1 Tax=Neolewinella agarilytica TaxID=478744 RepID=A0A1H9LZ44_9BACT|nr:helix-turn-helix transcriptional regulator [Neolewinella agarilytica]SER16696.1 Helix-turn-helix [Neolewinella agarilytica]
MYLAKNLSHLSHEKRVNNAALAKMLNISRSQVGNYMTGTSAPKIETLIQLAEFFDVNLDDLILKDLSQEAGRPFGAEGEGQEEADSTLKRMNELLEQRVKVVEMALKEENPELAKRLGIE